MWNEFVGTSYRYDQERSRYGLSLSGCRRGGEETVTEVMPKLRSAGLRVVDILPEGGKDADEMFRSVGTREAFIRWVEKGDGPSGDGKRSRSWLLPATVGRILYA